jgi:SAM-dependent methyltransferase
VAPEGLRSEEARIARVYARRNDAIPPDRYGYFEPGNLYLIQQRERRALRLLAQCGLRPLEDKKVLDVGCGNGWWLRELTKWGARPENLAGIDLVSERIAAARRLSAPGVELRCGSAAQLDWPSASFDLVIQSTVFTSILDRELRRRIAEEMLRVLRPRGIVLWYDFHVNNPKNPDVRGVRMAEIRELFPHCEISLRRVTLAPPIARVLARYSWLLCLVLEKVPWACTHYLGAIRKSR